MNQFAVILAAHGSGHEPAINGRVTALADELRSQGICGEAHAAFHQGEPSFATVLDRVMSRHVLVIPFMTASGWYSETVLPRELTSHPSFARRRVEFAAPIGAHASMVAIVARRAHRLMQWFELRRGDVTLALIGHGTPKHAASRDTTESLAMRLREDDVCPEVITAYLDDEPRVESIPDRATRPTILLEPFLINDGHHATVDVPRRIGLVVPPGTALPFLGEANARRVALDSPIGVDPGVIDLLIDTIVDYGRRLVPRMTA